MLTHLVIFGDNLSPLLLQLHSRILFGFRHWRKKRRRVLATIKLMGKDLEVKGIVLNLSRVECYSSSCQRVSLASRNAWQLLNDVRLKTSWFEPSEWWVCPSNNLLLQFWSDETVAASHLRFRLVCHHWNDVLPHTHTHTHFRPLREALCSQSDLSLEK